MKRLLLVMCIIAATVQSMAQVKVFDDSYTVKYTKTSPSGSWTSADFDDSGWSAYDGSVSCTGTESVWLRTNVLVLDDPSKCSLSVNYSWSGAFELYVNGNQTFGIRGNGSTYTRDISSSYLVKGKNTIAIHFEGGNYNSPYLNLSLTNSSNIIPFPKQTCLCLSESSADLFLVENNNYSQIQLAAFIATATSFSEPSVTWSSSNESVATVENGLVKAVGAGKATITAKTTYNDVEYSKSCDVNVTAFNADENVVFVDSVGKLSKLITADQQESWTNLTVFGDINGDDIAVLRKMAGRDLDNNMTAGKLAKLNLANANIMAGGTYRSGYTSTKNYISGGMFSTCNSLQEFIAPKSLTYINYTAFYQCAALKNVTLYEGITNINSEAFKECSNLETINIPSTVTSLGSSIFCNDQKLKTVDIPDNSVMTTMNYQAFYGCSALQSIRIPSGVTEIPSYAFQNCTALETVTFVDGSKLKTISNYAFSSCQKLNNVVLPETITAIQNAAFNNCYALSNITIPENCPLTSISSNVFNGCKVLNNVVLPKSLVTIESNAFCNCSALTNITIPAGCPMTTIGNNAFGNTGITTITIPATVVKIDNYAFQNCASLTTVNIPETSKLVTIGTNVFSGTKLNSLYIPKNVSDISNTGYSNSNFKAFTVNPDNTVFNAVDGVLYSKQDTLLIRVPQGFTGGFTIPATVKAIAEGAFDECTGIKAMYSLAATPPTCTEGALAFNKHSVPMFVPRGSLSGYKATAWTGVDNLMEYTEKPSIWFADKLITLYNTKFDETKNASVMAVAITSEGPSNAAISWTSGDNNIVTVDNSGKVTALATGITTIKASATINDVAVEATCPVNVVGFGENQTVLYVTAGNLSTLVTEDDKSSITDLVLFGSINSDDVRIIREMAGRDKDNKVTSGSLSKLDMAKVSIVSGGDYYITGNGSYRTTDNHIGGRMFSQCNNLTDVKLPESATDIDYCAFGTCTGLANVTLPDGLLRMDYGAFEYCSNLKSMEIPSTVTKLGRRAFQYCKKLTDVKIPENSDLTSIEDGTFYDCDALRSIYIPAKVESICINFCAGCDSLKSVVFDDNSVVTNIGSSAFSGDYKLQEIKLPASVTAIGGYAFYNCYGLNTFTIPENSALVSIDSYAFYNTRFSEIYLPATLTSIGDQAFNNCSNLETVKIADDSKLSTIGGYAFQNCSSLKGFAVPARMTSIGDQCFYGCSSLSDFTIPETSKLATVGNKAFYGCAITSLYIPQQLTAIENTSYNNSKLKTITVNAKNTTYKSVDGVVYKREDNSLLAVPSGYVGQFKSPDFLTSIPANAFSGCTNLRSVILSAKIDSVAANAFSGCSGLKVIHSLGATPPATLSASFNNLSTKNLPVFVPIGSLAAYKATTWGSFALLQEYSTTPSMWISENSINLYDTKFDETRYKEVSAVVLTPQGPSDAEITWTSADNAVATVNGGNIAIAGPNGNTVITASATVGTTPVKAECAVKTIGFAEGQNVYYVHAGGLSTLIPDSVMYNLTNLTLFGELNGSDLRRIRYMCGAGNYYSETNTNGKLADLDISNINIVSGGDRYVYGFGNNYYHYTENNSLQGGVFYNCRTLKNVKLPQSLVRLGTHTFCDCTSLETVEMPENTSVIEDNTFYNCNKLQTISCDWAKVDSIGSSAFNSCTSLSSVNLSTVTYIGASAFNNTRIKYITVNNVKSLGDNAFNSPTLEELHILSTEVPTLAGTGLVNTNRCVVVVPAASLTAYRTADGWTSFYQQIVPDDAQLSITREVTAETSGSGMSTAIGATPLTYVTHLTLTGSINSYDLMMMRNKMPNLHYLDLTGTTVEANPYEYITGCHTEKNRIGNKAFQGFVKLLEVKLPNSITYVGQNAFDGCKNMRSVTMYPGIVTIDNNAFYDCDSLTSVEIPATVAGINYGAFMTCDKLQNVTFHEGLLTIGSSAFYSCHSLKNIVLPSTTTNIGSEAFTNCDNLESISLPKNLTSIEYRLFSRCSSLKSIAIPSRVNTIGSYAFNGCSQLEEMRIPPMLETIGDQAFSGCSGLKDIYVYIANAKDISINQNTFACWTTATLHVPDFASNSYYWNTQWSQFVNITEFSEAYETFYTKNTMTLDKETGTIAGDPDATLYENGGLVVDGVDQTLKDVELTDNGTDGASLIAKDGGKLNIDKVTVTIKVTQYKWHFFCFPFDIQLDSVKYDGDYVWRQYDGAKRSRREGGWQNLAEGTTKLEKGRGYIFQGTKTGNLVMTVKTPDLTGSDVKTSLDTHESTSAQDAGWNFVGNPYTSYYNVTEETYASPITVWTGSSYEAYRPGDDDYAFAPYQAFFVQTDETGKQVSFDANQRESYTESKETIAKAKARRARARRSPSRLLINLELTAAGDTAYTDKTRVVFNNSKSLTYETDCDAAKFESQTAKAELYSLDATGCRYAINERPVEQGIVPLGVKVNEPGTYTISAVRYDGAVSLIDYQAGVTHDLTLGAYEFAAEKGDFSSRFALKLNNETTSIETLREKTGVEVSTDGGITIQNVADDTDIRIYNLSGACVKKQKGAGTISVPTGTYLLTIGASTVKVMVK